MNLDEAKSALKFADWNALLSADDGTLFPVIVNGEPALAEKVFSEDKEDADYDRNITVVVRVGEQFYRQGGWSQVGSHCYGDYEPSWNNDLTEVTPVEKTVTLYE